MTPFDGARAVTAERLRQNAANHFFAYAERDLDRIEQPLGEDGRLTKEAYAQQSLGLMCARELETSDAESCEIVHRMLYDVRSQ